MIFKPTANSHFSGCGGMDLGLIQAGVNVQQSFEMDKSACETLRRNFDHEVIEGDITKKLVESDKESDIIVGTYPCTKYSTIADIHGVRTGDELFLHFFRHTAIKQPEAYVIENVPGMRKFPVVMEAMTKLPGYYINLFCPLNTLHWLPQDRKRLIIIGTKRRISISEPKGFKRQTIRDILEHNPEYNLPNYLLKRFNGQYRDKPIIVDPYDSDSIAPTCVAHYSKDQSTRVVKDNDSPIGIRPFTKREYARLQGFPDWFYLPDNNQAYKQVGNAVAVPMGRWIGEQLIKYFNQSAA